MNELNSSRNLSMGNKRMKPALTVGLILLLLFFIADIVLGSVIIPLDQVGRAITGGGSVQPVYKTIVWNFRINKAITAVLAGASLSLCGLILQTLFQNPLAGPTILGISSGASLGVALVIFFSGINVAAGHLFGAFQPNGKALLLLAAGGGASLTLLLLFVCSLVLPNMMILLLLGLLLSYISNALITILMYLGNSDSIALYVGWTFGSFNNVSWYELPWFALLTVAAVICGGLLAAPLNGYLLGEDNARGLGISTGALKAAVISLSGVLVATVTLFCGPVAFIGIAIPHLCRSLIKSNNQQLLQPLTLIYGAVTALAADIVAHLPTSDTVLPLNAVTSLIGAPFVIIIMLGNRVHEQ